MFQPKIVLKKVSGRLCDIARRFPVRVLAAVSLALFILGMVFGLYAEDRFRIIDRLVKVWPTGEIRKQEKTPPRADQIHWTILGPAAVAFHWRGTETVIRYGEQAGTYPSTATSREPIPLPTSSPGPYREVKLEGLKPDTLYHYSIADSGDNVFHTPPVGWTRSFAVAVEGDIGTSKRAERVQSMIATIEPAFVLAVGDLTYANQGGQNRVDKHFNIVSPWAKGAAYMPVWGNHEFKPNDPTDNYIGRFILPNVEALASSRKNGENITRGKDWYWFDYGHVRFVSYPEPMSETDAEWFEWAKVMQDPAGPMAVVQKDATIKFIVAFGHQPAYSSGKEPGSAALSGIFADLTKRHPKLVLVLNGHSHNYERTLPMNDLTFVTVGTGGESLQHVQLEKYESGTCLWTVCPGPDWSAKRFFRFGFLKLAFEQDRIRGEFVCGPASDKERENRHDIECSEGEIIDTFEIRPRP